MIRRRFLIISTALFLGLSAGAQNKAVTTPSKKSSTATKPKSATNRTKVLEFTGIIKGESTTMNSLTAEDVDKGISRTFILNDKTNRKYSNGMLDGNICIVKYIKTKEGKNLALAYSTLKGYNDAVGRWTMPDPINAEMKMGVEIMVRGKASSINMATLPYNAWTLGDKEEDIILYGRSIGNGNSSFIESKGVISKKNGKLIMTLENGTIYTKE